MREIQYRNTKFKVDDRDHDVFLSIHGKLSAAVRIAPIMVDDAIDGITSLLAAANLHRNRIQPIQTAGKEDAVLTFRKYFNLPWDDRFFDKVYFVLFIYRRICRGLAEPHDIVLFLNDATKHGYVPADESRFDPALKAYMNTKPDEQGHVPWPDVPTGDIHLNLAWLVERNVTSEAIARTIVHEASHKWAYTTDQCYKSASIAKVDAASELLPDGSTIRDSLIAIGAQPSHRIPGRAKPLLPMTSWEHEQRNVRLSTEDWLRNADSYAWAARRFWKRAGRKGA